jgi:hypothetical protein
MCKSGKKWLYAGRRQYRDDVTNHCNSDDDDMDAAREVIPLLFASESADDVIVRALSKRSRPNSSSAMPVPATQHCHDYGSTNNGSRSDTVDSFMPVSAQSSPKNLSVGVGTSTGVWHDQRQTSAETKRNASLLADSAWGVGSQLRQDVGMMLLEGVVRAVRFPVNDLEDSEAEQGVPGVAIASEAAVCDPSPVLARDDVTIRSSAVKKQQSFMLPPKSSPEPTVSASTSPTPAGPTTVTSAHSIKITLSSDSAFTVFEHSKFAKIRTLFDVAPETIANSLAPEKLESGEVVAKFSDGRSSSFFCKSADNLFVVKTMSATETMSLLEFLPNYVLHIQRYPTTMITIIYGLYCLEASSCGDVYAIVMANVFRPPNGLHVHEVYDLKGSTYHRQAEKGEATEMPSGWGVDIEQYRGCLCGEVVTLACVLCRVLMDVDFKRRRGDVGLRLGPVVGPAFLDQLRKDVELLKVCCCDCLVWFGLVWLSVGS